MPLFNYSPFFPHSEPSSTDKEVLNLLRRNLFKNMLGLSKRTSTCLVSEMIRKDLEVLADEVSSSNTTKWDKIKELYTQTET